MHDHIRILYVKVMLYALRNMLHDHIMLRMFMFPPSGTRDDRLGHAAVGLTH